MLSSQALQAFFARCYVVNLDSRPDRWESIQQNVIPLWPFSPLERWPGINGNLLPHPPWWNATGGAWGVYRTHLAIIEKCLNENVESVLILEDDALPCPDFPARVAEFLAAVPGDWGMIYLGGQHLFTKRRQPRPINDQVMVPFNVNRCHAFAVHQRSMAKVYAHLTTTNEDYDGSHHIDHQLGYLHMHRKVKVYCPTHWLIDQGPGKSDIDGMMRQRRSWNNDGALPLGTRAALSVPALPAVVAVLAPFHGGGREVAGMLHELGISAGDGFAARVGHDTPGSFEDEALRRLCRQTCAELVDVDENDVNAQVAGLQEWAGKQRSPRAQGGGDALIAAYHPRLCLMMQAMSEAWPRLKLVVVDRPRAEVVRQLRKAQWDGISDEAQEVTRSLLRQRELGLAAVRSGVPVLRINSDDLRPAGNAGPPPGNAGFAAGRPQQIVQQLAAFAGVTPTAEQVARALKILDFGLRISDCNSKFKIQNPKSPVQLPRVVAVVGPSRCGSSCIAGVLQRLGVPMGEDYWVPPDWKNPKGYYEDKGLVALWRAAYPRPGSQRSRLSREEGTARLRRWLKRRAQDGPPAAAGKSLIGGKQEVLCYLVPEMAAAWPDVRIIIPERPVAEIVASMVRAGFNTNLTPEQITAKVQAQIAARDQALCDLDSTAAPMPLLRLPFADVVRAPRGAIDKIMAFLGINPTPQQVQAAVEFVDPQLKHSAITAA